MSHERSTPSPGPEEFASSPSSTLRFSASPSSSTREIVPLTGLERFAMSKPDSSLRALAGATGGFASGVVACPLDVIKTKLQAQGGFRAAAAMKRTNIPPRDPHLYKGMIGTASTIWREEGLRGMYRGLGPIILGYIPTWAVYFSVYGKSKDFFAERHVNINTANFWSSIMAGACGTMVTNPIWVIKTRLMSQVSPHSTTIDARPAWNYRGTIDAAKQMYRTEGLMSFYGGLTPALLGLSHVAVQFPTYEYLKTRFTGQGLGMMIEGDDSSHLVGVISASVLSKIIASSATYPHEVIRTRLQTQQRVLPGASSALNGGTGSEHHKPRNAKAMSEGKPLKYQGLVGTFKTILKEEGWRAFYAGLTTNMWRAVPAATTTILTYEYLMQHLNHAKSEGIHKTEGKW
ncbi:mitochondrial carrier domain-containing protein [Tricladium varicosporioides]|nr:mitochondrial carrier domain-containing protein [Hymenoscyphus varicosporioides]